MQKCTLALGCFWKPEDNFKNKPGIIETEVGYAGGKNSNATYEEVCGGKTGHAEVVRLTFDEKLITYEKILQIQQCSGCSYSIIQTFKKNIFQKEQILCLNLVFVRIFV